MKLLLIHTCGLEGSVALGDETDTFGELCLGERKASEELMPAVRRLLRETGWKVQELQAIGVVRGPGSFTGVRTGWSVGKGICEALGIPLVGISRLALLASKVPAVGTVHAVLDAGRGQFYVGRFQDGVLKSPGLVGADKLTGSGHWVACELKVAAALRHVDLQVVSEPSAADARTAVLDGLARNVNDVLADALYLRQTDAEIFGTPSAPKAAGG